MADQRAKKRDDRYRLRDCLSQITTLKRVKGCGRHQIDKNAAPVVRVQGDGGARVAHYSGLQLCGSIHACPVCSPRIRQQRALDVDKAAETWLADHGEGSLLFLTLTMPHDHADRLKGLLATIRASFAALVSGRGWQADKAAFGIEFYIVSHDVTVGAAGWHPHLHVLLFASQGGCGLTDDDVSALGDRLHKRWSRAVTRRGHRAPTREHGLQLERARNRSDVARYVCQIVAGDDEKPRPIALEMARGDLKRSRYEGQRSPWQLLADLADRRSSRAELDAAAQLDDARDVKLWHEYERATKGVQAIRWARKLRAAVGLQTEKTDDEIVAEEIGGDIAHTFAPDDSWRAVSTTRGGRARVLRAAERGGAVAIQETVRAIVTKWRKRRRAVGVLDSTASLLLHFPKGIDAASERARADVVKLAAAYADETIGSADRPIQADYVQLTPDELRLLLNDHNGLDYIKPTREL